MSTSDLRLRLAAILAAILAVERGSGLRHRFDTFPRVAAGLEDPSVAQALR